MWWGVVLARQSVVRGVGPQPPAWAPARRGRGGTAAAGFGEENRGKLGRASSRWYERRGAAARGQLTEKHPASRRGGEHAPGSECPALHAIAGGPHIQEQLAEL
jgi:hypothetical protein